MALIERQLQEVWDALRQEGARRPNILTEVRIRNLRGIRDLRVPFNYPVCVLAGPNGCGKSTALFACACAYRVPKAGPRDFVPSTLFPNFTSSKTAIADDRDSTELEFHYLSNNERVSMLWKRGKAWNRSFMGRKGGSQPERPLYLRTLANLTNPSEVRSLLQLGRRELQEERITDDLLILAHRVLPRRYRSLSQISAQSKDLLFAELEGASAARYSEFHMSSGERAILRMSKDISNLKDALILIDEVEAGLHPYTQQQVMLEFQRIALRNRLQIIVASHSPVVLESVPADGRLFLDRDEDTAEVRLAPPYRDIMQKALYGQSRDRLSILCEDAVAEALLRGFLDVLNVELALRHEDIIIGRDTGSKEFSTHIRALAKFNKLSEFLMALDGDSRDMEAELRSVAEQYGQAITPLFLPGNDAPEVWIWQTLTAHRSEYAGLLGIADIERRMEDIESMISGGLQHQNRSKAFVDALAVETDRTAPDIARIVGKHEAEVNRVGVRSFMVELRERINAWRRP